MIGEDRTLWKRNEMVGRIVKHLGLVIMLMEGAMEIKIVV